ncbi:MAG TPA: PQQ-binding-like beta-propeller repeat protein, partial [Steroidobacteraceae bacterium]
MSFKHTLSAAVLATFAVGAALADTDRGNWPYYAGTIGATKYSPLTRINARNVASLQAVWTWESPDNALVGTVTKERPGSFKATPIMIDGVLYTSTSLNLVAAIDAGTGKTLWTFDPKAYESGRRPANSGWQHRGVSYWEGRVDGRKERRIFIATGIGELIALNAQDGQPIRSFGKEGRVDLHAHLIRREEDRRAIGFNSPQLVVGDVIV